MNTFYAHVKNLENGDFDDLHGLMLKHDTALGNAPAHKLFDCVKVKRIGEGSNPSRAYADYEIKLDAAPVGVKIEEKI